MLRTCKECGEKFDLLPGKPGLSNVCPQCTQNAEDVARKAADAESLRKQWSASLKENDRRREELLKEDRELAKLGYERVPGKTLKVEIPKSNRKPKAK
jgi:predicted  nucleic acid-binding Zn-ribbon protein